MIITPLEQVSVANNKNIILLRIKRTVVKNEVINSFADCPIRQRYFV